MLAVPIDRAAARVIVLSLPAEIPKLLVFKMLPVDVSWTEPVAEILSRIKFRKLGTTILLKSWMSPDHCAEISPELVMAFRDRVFVEPASPVSLIGPALVVATRVSAFGLEIATGVAAEPIPLAAFRLSVEPAALIVPVVVRIFPVPAVPDELMPAERLPVVSGEVTFTSPSEP